MTDELKKFITGNKTLFQRNNFEKLFSLSMSLGGSIHTELMEFLYNQAKINPLEYMANIPEDLFRNVSIAQNLIIPSNIKSMAKDAIYRVSAASIIIESGASIGDGKSFNMIYSPSIIIQNGVDRLPNNFCINSPDIKTVRLPESVRRIGRNCFSYCGNDLKIITPYRDDLANRLIVPKGEIEQYRKWLRFTHKPKEADNADEQVAAN